MSAKKNLKRNLEIAQRSEARTVAERDVHEANASAWRDEAQRLRAQLDAKAAAPPAQPAPAAPPPPPAKTYYEKYREMRVTEPYRAAGFLLEHEHELDAPVPA